MMAAEMMGAFTQFGVAGLVCWMWLCERRASAERERQITEAHEKLIGQSDGQRALIEVVRENTKALAALEVGQRSVIAAMERVSLLQRSGQG